LPAPNDQAFKEQFSWEKKATHNPLFAVMAVGEFAEKGADPSEWTREDLERFFAKGQFIYDLFLRPVIERNGLNREDAFIVEYGSGMGRILRAVNAAGFKCAGIDISPTMLKYSSLLVPQVPQLLALGEHGHCDIPTGSADLVYSFAVMQHIPTLKNVRTAIAEMSRMLKPGGLLKLHFRTMSSPFKELGFTHRRWVHNFELTSLILRWAKPWKAVPALPLLVLVRHTNWVGVPLSYYNLQRFLNKAGVRLIGIEQDVGLKTGFAWALGRKD